VNAHSRLALAVAAAALGSAAPAGCLGGHERPVLRPEVFERDPKFGERRIPATTTYTLAIPWLGEVNAVAVELTAEGFVVRDAAGVTAGDGCAVADATTVTCSTPPEPGTTLSNAESPT